MSGFDVLAAQEKITDEKASPDLIGGEGKK